MDKLSKRILRYMVKTGKTTDFVWSFDQVLIYQCKSSIYELSDRINIPTEDVRACIRYLNEIGYIEYQYTRTSKEHRAVGFHLSHKGLHYKHFRKQEILAYIAEKWIDFLSMLLSLAAIIISIIALMTPK